MGTTQLAKAFNDYLRFGGFPEVCAQTIEIEKIRTISAYFREILGINVAAATGTELTAVELFGRYLLQSPYFSASICLNLLKSVGFKLGKDRALELERAAADSMLFHFVPVYSRSIKDRT